MESRLAPPDARPLSDESRQPIQRHQAIMGLAFEDRPTLDRRPSNMREFELLVSNLDVEIIAIKKIV